jgi:hypothetical protein
MPYMALVRGQPNLKPSSVRLRNLGMKAMPALIDALQDDTPTRTVYFWRDFARDRLVWRVSDFAWHIIRDITKKEFGDRPVGGFTLSSMSPAQKAATIESVKKWHAENKDRSRDEQMFGLFKSEDSNDWLTAGKYFLKAKDKRAVDPLIEKIAVADHFRKGDLCELVGQFGDAKGKEALAKVLKSAEEPSDRVSAAIGLWNLGDAAGVPVAIEYLKAADQPYGDWEKPIWFLMHTRSPQAMEALTAMVTEGPRYRAGEVLNMMVKSINGDLWDEQRESAGSVEAARVFAAAMRRSESAGGSGRIKDLAAVGFVSLRGDVEGPVRQFARPDPKVFNPREPDEKKRDRQIEVLLAWYNTNKDKLVWNSSKQKLEIKKPQ